MSSAAFRQGRYLRPEDRELTPDVVEAGADKEEKTPKKRVQFNVYDAVAGRISTVGYVLGALPAGIKESARNSNSTAIYPEEVLFRNPKAPARIAEDDLYWADRHLTSSQKLPDSELLKEIHTFTADYYSRTTDNDPKGVYRTMDETALLAMGILLEESVAQVLGENGDLAFMEGELIADDEENKQSPTMPKPAPRSKVPKRMPKRNASRKKRKLDDGNSTQ